MSDIILKAENISKQYRLGLVGTGTISHDLNRWWHKVRGKDDPFLKIGETNDRSVKGESDYVWALKDINFEVKRGEVLGIIGKNGAGKSTLLKILSRVTSPTTGEIKTKGRIASLLEVGTGFHREMTGRENIYLNGAILGMTKKEIRVKIDEIIDFSGCQRYIDTPVKRYSSGMTVRLAFAVAAFLEPDILVIDEVLAVGDAEFQKKAIGKMQDISKGEGRTVLFVSHNMTAVKSLCSRCLVIKNGLINFEGNVDKAIQYYLKGSTGVQKINDNIDRKGNAKIKIENFRAFGTTENDLPQIGKPLNLEFTLIKPKEILNTQIEFDIRIDDALGQRIIWMNNNLNNSEPNRNFNIVIFYLKKLNLNKGIYYVSTYIKFDNEITDWLQHAFQFEVIEGIFYSRKNEIPVNQGKLLAEFDVKYNDK